MNIYEQILKNNYFYYILLIYNVTGCNTHGGDRVSV